MDGRQGGVTSVTEQAWLATVGWVGISAALKSAIAVLAMANIG